MYAQLALRNQINFTLKTFIIQVGRFATLSKSLTKYFHREDSHSHKRNPNVVSVTGAFVNQGKVENLHVTIKNYYLAPGSFGQNVNNQRNNFPIRNSIEYENFEKVTVIDNTYYE